MTSFPTSPASTPPPEVAKPVTRLVPPIPRYERADPNNLPAMQLTERDRRILEAVHAYDGVLSENQIRTLFFGGRTATQTRLMLLYQHGYLNRPNRRQRAALSTMVYWLAEKGAAIVAGLSGQPLEELAYRKEPRWSQLEHDLSVNNLRLSVKLACEKTENFTLEEWLPETEFHALPDRVEYTLPNGSKATRQVTPDGYCLISRQGKPFRFLWEMDKRTEDNPRFVREKVLPGLVYLTTPAYKARFGSNSGQWLIITTGERRLRNMKRQTEQAAKEQAKYFYFTTFSQITPDTIFTAPIWYRGGDTEAIPLFKPMDRVLAASASSPRFRTA